MVEWTVGEHSRKHFSTWNFPISCCMWRSDVCRVLSTLLLILLLLPLRMKLFFLAIYDFQFSQFRHFESKVFLAKGSSSGRTKVKFIFLQGRRRELPFPSVYLLVFSLINHEFRRGGFSLFFFSTDQSNPPIHTPPRSPPPPPPSPILNLKRKNRTVLKWVAMVTTTIRNKFHKVLKPQMGVKSNT